MFALNVFFSPHFMLLKLVIIESDFDLLLEEKLAEKVGRLLNSTQKMYINMILSGTSMDYTMIERDSMGQFKWVPSMRHERLARVLDRLPSCLADKTGQNFYNAFARGSRFSSTF